MLTAGTEKEAGKSNPGPYSSGRPFQLQKQYLEVLKSQPQSQIVLNTNSSLRGFLTLRKPHYLLDASTEAAAVWSLGEPARPQTASAAEKVHHQEKEKGNEKAGAKSLNEILNHAILTLMTPCSQAKEAEELFVPTLQQLAFPWCAVMELLAPWGKMRNSSPGGSHSFSSRTLAMLMRCSQLPPQNHCKLGARSVCSLPGRDVSFPSVIPGSLH